MCQNSSSYTSTIQLLTPPLSQCSIFISRYILVLFSCSGLCLNGEFFPNIRSTIPGVEASRWRWAWKRITGETWSLGIGSLQTKQWGINRQSKLGMLKEEARRHKDLHDSNIVILYDSVFTSTVCGLFIEFMKYGTVEQFLKEFGVSTSWKTRIMFETASAMSYLHRQEPVIIHGDLSCQNILIGDEFHAKVSDFGLARILKEHYSCSLTNTSLRGKISYIAPEYLAEPRKRKSVEFDIYSFAISAWEILSEKTPYSHHADKRLIPIFVGKGERPNLNELDAKIPPTIRSLIEDCWHRNENKRPNFNIIKDCLFSRLSAMQPELSRSYSSLREQEQIRSLRYDFQKWRTNTKMLIYSRSFNGHVKEVRFGKSEIAVVERTSEWATTIFVLIINKIIFI